MDRAFRKGYIEIDFPATPFDSVGRLLVRATRLFLSSLPFVATMTLAVFLPGKLLVQLACWLLDFPAEGVVSYLANDFGDLILGALVAPALIFGLMVKLRKGKTGGFSESLRWGRRQWVKSLWNRFKVEITIMLWSVMLIIPGVVVMLKLIYVDPVVAIEADREPEVLPRSRELSAGCLWRIFLSILPALPLSLAHMYAALRALQYSRWLMVPIDSAFCVLDQWMTVVVLLLYLGLAAEPGPTEAAKRKAA